MTSSELNCRKNQDVALRSSIENATLRTTLRVVPSKKLSAIRVNYELGAHLLHLCHQLLMVLRICSKGLKDISQSL